MSALVGRTAVVTGAGTGIGRAIALRLASAGASLALLGRTRASLEKVAGEAKGETLVHPVDVRDRAAVDAAFDAAANRFGKLHLLVANAGIGGPDEVGGEDRFDDIVRTNLHGAWYSARAFLRHVAPGPDPRHIVVISSCIARFGVPGIAAYSAAKAGQLGLVRSLAVELAPQGVRVNAILPGWVDTQMAEDRMREIAAAGGQPYEAARRELTAAVPLQRISEPDEIAGVVEFLASPAGAAFTGQSLDPNNGAWMG
jgi:NAD(P)-dependent dehydrogenase (short-subunit alcohol dehydrogenase family)